MKEDYHKIFTFATVLVFLPGARLTLCPVFPHKQNNGAGDCVQDFLSFDLLEISGNMREQRIPLNHVMDNGKIDPVRQRYCLMENLSAAADENFV
jgi:hypothetical protein